MVLKKGNIAEAYLISELRSQSHEVFEYIFKMYYPDLYRLANAYLMSGALAEDIVQDVFVSLWEMAKTLPFDTNLKQYLYSSVKHGCLDYLKHLQVIDSSMDKLTEALVFSGTVEYEDNQELLEKVRQVLSELPNQQRKVLELKFFKGMNYKEIAIELNVSEESVHTHVKRAYKFLRDAFPAIFIVLRLLEW